jgi:anti-sigma regulatory factor (Ser/Thr protein kinase)
VAESLTIEVRNSRDAIVPASAQAEQWLEQRNASPQALNLVILAIEELVMNCIHYGYDDTNEHTIVIELAVDGETLSLTVIDDGHPFDPLHAPEPDFSVEIEDRPAGGLGIYLLRSLADDMVYERRDGTNRLTLKKQLT